MIEPMTLGSPSSSPVTSPYLPSFLMGNPQSVSTPRSNTFSPNKIVTRNVSFASHQDANQNSLGQKALFNNQAPTLMQATNSNLTGPPAKDLFDSLYTESKKDSPTNILESSSDQTCFVTHAQNNQLDHTGIKNIFISPNSPRIMSPIQGKPNELDYDSTAITSTNALQYTSRQSFSDFWVTVFGFPQSASAMILSHFSQCGTIIDKRFPPHSGNWVHLRYSSRLECEKARNYNEKLFGNIMIGVSDYKNNLQQKVSNNQSTKSRTQSLCQIEYENAYFEASVDSNAHNLRQTSSGIMSRAMDLFFGW